MTPENKLIKFFKSTIRKIFSFLHIGFIEIIFLICCVILWYGPKGYTIDGYYQLVQLVSIFEDGDLDIYNNLANWPYNIPIMDNQWSFGPAILWAPFYLIGHLVFNIVTTIFPSLLNIWGGERLIFLLDVSLANLGTMFYIYVGLKFLGLALNSYYSKMYERKISTICQLFALFCTPLIFYVFRNPLKDHALSFFLVCILVYLWVKWHDILTIRQILIVSCLVGIMTMVRMQNILFVVIFIPQIQRTLAEWKKDKRIFDFIKQLFLGIFLAIFGFFIAFSPQLIAWWVQHGIPLPVPWSKYDFYFFEPDFFEVWFGVHGLFIWHPLFILCAFGFILFFILRDLNKYDGIVLIIPFFLQSYVWGIFNPLAWPSFGMRGLIGTIPLLTFGLANVVLVGYQRNRKIMNITFGILLILFSFMNLYLVALVGQPYGDPTLRFNVPLNIEWFLNIDWELIRKTFVPTFPFQVIVILSALAFLVILASSTINYFKKKEDLKNLQQTNSTF